MIIAGNWKMNMTRGQAIALTESLSEYRKEAKENQMVLFPPSVLIDTVHAHKGSGIELGGQDCHHADSGAHTGDIAAVMLAEAGCSWVLLGHSERRTDHHETSTQVVDKARAAMGAGLKAMICVGETLDLRESGNANETVQKQILESLPDEIKAGQFAVAYEPIWAIGTGQVASAEDVDAMHNHIRSVLTSRHESYGEVEILYGGSVKPDNAASLLKLDNVGGALVGGASLKADDFIAIAEAAW